MARAVARGVAVLAALVVGLLLAGPAFAGPASTSPGKKTTLAATGLNVTVPVVIGLSLLVVGTAVVAWVALRGGRTGRRRHL
jgi:hypothetical protein